MLDDRPTLKVVELCSGIGCQLRGLENSGVFDVECVATSEINTDAIICYSAIHHGLTEEMVDNYDFPPLDEMREYLEKLNIGYSPEKDTPYNWRKSGKVFERKIKKTYLACLLSKNLGDISRIECLPKANLWFISAPCFVEGTLVFTNKGYVQIEDVKVGDYVLTHSNNYEKVNDIMVHEADSLMKISCMASEDIHCTPNHKFYVRARDKIWNESRRSYDRLFHEPEWVEAKDLSKDYYLGTAINQKCEIPEWNGYINGKGTLKNNLKKHMGNSDFWYLIGRFIGDGWVVNNRGIVICANKSELMSLIECLDKLEFNYSIVEERTVHKVHIGFREIGIFCEQFGRGAINKHLTEFVLNLPVDLLRSFIEGYMSADGYQDAKGLYKVSSISRRLLYDVASCVHKVYHRPTSMYFTARKKTNVIEGRIVNQHDTYSLCWKLDTNSQDKAFYEDGYIWSPINDINKEEYHGLVYNLSVEKDESYMIQNVIVHNCSDISNAGRMEGLAEGSGTRSSIVWNTIRLLRKAKEMDALPEYMMLENVKNLVSKVFINDFNRLNEKISEFGYNVYYQIIDAKNTGIPQHRERVFVVYIRKDIDKCQFTFPQPFDNGVYVNDVLFDEVDESYYIETEKSHDLIKEIVDSDRINLAEIADAGGMVSTRI